MLNLKKLISKILDCCNTLSQHSYEEGTVDQGSYTWTYRLYADGWLIADTKASFTISSYMQLATAMYGYYVDFALPFTMANANYYIHAKWTIGNGFAWDAGNLNITTTTARSYAIGSASGSQACTATVHLEGKIATS